MYFRSRGKPVWTGLVCMVILYALFIRIRGRPRFNRVFFTSINGASDDLAPEEPALFYAHELLKQKQTHKGNKHEQQPADINDDICKRCSADASWAKARNNALVLNGGAHLLTTLFRDGSFTSEIRFAELIESVSRNIMLFPLVSQQHIFIADAKVKIQLSTLLLRKGMAQSTIASAITYVLVQEQPTYGQLFQYANEHLAGRVVVAHQPDIHFDQQLACMFVSGLKAPSPRAVKAMQRKATSKNNKISNIEGQVDISHQKTSAHAAQRSSAQTHSGANTASSTHHKSAHSRRRLRINDEHEVTASLLSVILTSDDDDHHHGGHSALPPSDLEMADVSQISSILANNIKLDSDRTDRHTSRSHQGSTNHRGLSLNQLHKTIYSEASNNNDNTAKKSGNIVQSNEPHVSQKTHKRSNSMKQMGPKSNKFRAFALTRHPAKDCPARSGGDPFSSTIPQNMCTTMQKGNTHKDSHITPGFVDSFDSFVFVSPLAQHVVSATNHVTPTMSGSANMVVQAMAQTGLWVTDPCFDLVSYHLHCSSDREKGAMLAASVATNVRGTGDVKLGHNTASTYDGNSKYGRVNGRTRIRLCSDLLHECFAAGCA